LGTQAKTAFHTRRVRARIPAQKWSQTTG
jgi:hypothetical protein